MPTILNRPLFKRLINITTDFRRKLAVLSLDHKFYLGTFILLSALLITPIWTITYLPLGDLPEHAAQIRAIIEHEHYSTNYSINWFTPYLAGYAITILLAAIIPVTQAIKITLSIALIGIPLASAALIRSLHGNKYWVWTAFPAAYGFSFHWGFFSFVIATPIAIAFFAFLFWYISRPLEPRIFLAAIAFSAFLFFAHALAWLFSMAMAVAIFFMYRQRDGFLKRMLPLFIVLPIVLYWVSSSSHDRPKENRELGSYSEQYIERAQTEANYIIREFNQRTEKSEHGKRIKEFVALSIGMPAMFDFVILAGILLSWPLWLGARLSRDWRRYLPPATVVGFFMITPYWIFDTAYVYERFSAFLLPCSFFIFESATKENPPTNSWRSRLLKSIPYAAGLILTTWTLSITLTTFKKFKNNDQDFKQILSVMEPDKKVLQLIFDQDSIFKYSPPYLHFSSWYQTEKLGEVFMSFSHAPSAGNVPVRYRGDPGKFPSVWNPSEFNWAAHSGSRYDYFLVRAYQPKSDLFKDSGGTVVLIKQQGAWQLYGRTALAHPQLPKQQ